MYVAKMSTRATLSCTRVEQERLLASRRLRRRAQMEGRIFADAVRVLGVPEEPLCPAVIAAIRLKTLAPAMSQVSVSRVVVQRFDFDVVRPSLGSAASLILPLAERGKQAWHYRVWADCVATRAANADLVHRAGVMSSMQQERACRCQGVNPVVMLSRSQVEECVAWSSACDVFMSLLDIVAADGHPVSGDAGDDILEQWLRTHREWNPASRPATMRGTHDNVLLSIPSLLARLSSCAFLSSCDGTDLRVAALIASSVRYQSLPCSHLALKLHHGRPWGDASCAELIRVGTAVRPGLQDKASTVDWCSSRHAVVYEQWLEPGLCMVELHFHDRSSSRGTSIRMLITMRRIRALVGSVSDATLRKVLRLPESSDRLRIIDVLRSPDWPTWRALLLRSIVVDERCDALY